VQVPLFPLNTVLFPGGPLPLRIFEPRYLTMVSDCVQHDTTFGVLLIREGRETGRATTHEIGTLARITDWYQGSDGLLGVTAIGEQRFRVVSSSRRADGLNIGTVEILPDEPAMPLPDEDRALSDILASVLDDLGRLYASLERHMDDAAWVTSRFIEILPLELEEKQHYLESSGPAERLRIVRELLNAERAASASRG
jgi:Lon protease-like protein